MEAATSTTTTVREDGGELRSLPNAEEIIEALSRKGGNKVKNEKSLGMRLRGNSGMNGGGRSGNGGGGGRGLCGSAAWRAFEMHVLHETGTAPAALLSMLFGAMLREEKDDAIRHYQQMQQKQQEEEGGGGGGGGGDNAIRKDSGPSRRQRKEAQRYLNSGLRPVHLDEDALCEGVVALIAAIQADERLNVPEVLDVVVYNSAISALCSRGKLTLAERLVSLLFTNTRCARGDQKKKNNNDSTRRTERQEELGRASRNTSNLQRREKKSGGSTSTSGDNSDTSGQSWNNRSRRNGGGGSSSGNTSSSIAARTEWALRPSIATLEPLIFAWARSGQVKRSVAIVSMMERDAGIYAREATFNGLIQSCCDARPEPQINLALELLQRWLNDACDVEKIAQRGAQVRPTAATYGIIMTGLVRGGQPVEAVKLLVRMPNEGVRPKAGNFNIIIDGLAKATNLQDNARAAEDWLREMQGGGLFDVESLGIEPDVQSYGCVIEAYAAQGNLEAAKRIVKTMRQNGIEPDVTIFGSLVKACGRAGAMDELDAVLRKMRLVHGGAESISSTSSSTTIDLPMVEANVVVMTSAVAGFVAGGDLESARRLLLDRMESEFGVTPTRASYHALLSGYAIAGMAGEAQELVALWRARIEASGVGAEGGRRTKGARGVADGGGPDKETQRLLNMAVSGTLGAEVRPSSTRRIASSESQSSEIGGRRTPPSSSMASAAYRRRCHGAFSGVVRAPAVIRPRRCRFSRRPGRIFHHI